MTQEEYLKYMEPFRAEWEARWEYCYSRAPSEKWFCTLEKGHVHPTHVATYADGFILAEWDKREHYPKGSDGYW